jgi:hypothetical protein
LSRSNAEKAALHRGDPADAERGAAVGERLDEALAARRRDVAPVEKQWTYTLCRPARFASTSAA